jgi:hypothetical protein
MRSLIVLFGFLLIEYSCGWSAGDVNFNKDEYGIITIHNNKNTPISILNIDELFTYQYYQKSIDSLKQKYAGLELANEIWKWTSNNFDFSVNSFSKYNTHDPFIQLNSLGYGQCDDLATLLFTLWHKAGFKSRLWSLNNHIVPEVLIEEKWHMLDPSFGIYFLNNNGIIASVNELAQDLNLICNPKIPIMKISSRSHLPDSLFSCAYISKYYTGIDESRINIGLEAYTRLKSSEVALPKSSTLSLPHENITIFNESFRNTNTINQKYALLKIRKGIYSNLHVPLLLAGINGRCSIQFKTEHVAIINNNSDTVRVGIYDPNIELEVLDDEVTLFYLINLINKEKLKYWEPTFAHTNP